MRITSRTSGASRWQRVAQRLSVLLVLALVGALPLDAQEDSESRGAYASRNMLERQAAELEQKASDASLPDKVREYHRGEAWLIRQRLTEGDFVTGDRIVLAVAGEPALTDTFTVRAGPEIQLSTLPPIGLSGVLRSELTSHLGDELGRYIREPNVRANVLVRIAVMGQVARPGYYNVPADMLLTDVLMAAGGPGTDTDLSKSSIKRGERDLYSSNDVRIAFSDGMSLDALSIRSGDELHLGQRRRISWTSLLQAASLAAGLVTLFFSFKS